jgi:hypothetical protein
LPSCKPQGIQVDILSACKEGWHREWNGAGSSVPAAAGKPLLRIENARDKKHAVAGGNPCSGTTCSPENPEESGAGGKPVTLRYSVNFKPVMGLSALPQADKNL